MQNQMFILRSVLKVKFTKYCTCAAGNPAQPGELSRLWTGFFISVELEPYMLKAYLGKKLPFGSTLNLYGYCFWLYVDICIGIGVGIVVGVGICIGICVGVGIGIGIGIGSISQHLASGGIWAGSIWQHLGSSVSSGIIWQHLGAPGIIWRHLAGQHLAASGILRQHLAASGGI